ncbi:hypothetical protein B0H14DRAFT_3597294 [Mycena olivaceomarginata]|nr:hypothetical protein B0H14DRAFT_3597294 [Mycena olivaceomarginata]
MSTAPPGLADKCVYDVSWMRRTFYRRKYSESLLTPELENGNLTRKDYDALLALGSGAWKTERRHDQSVVSFQAAHKVIAALGGYFFGEVVGWGLRLNGHNRYFRSVEDVNGFARAMENIVRPLSSAYGEPAAREPQPFQKETDTPYGESLPEQAAEAAAPTSRPPPAAAAKSRWEEIRAARRADGPGKAWENIRQGRRPDGTALPKKSEFDTRSEPSEATPFRDTDRAAAQASFDAMLERERRMGSSSS